MLVFLLFVATFAAPTRDCYFIHGAGIDFFGSNPKTPTFTDYWGDVHEYTRDSCKNQYFIHMDTRRYPFYHPIYTRSICAMLSDEDPNLNSTIRNKIIFTHSMGNIMLAFALKTEQCRLELNSSDWFASSPPTLGSEGVETMRQVCNSTNSTWKKAIGWVAEKLHYCQNNTVYPSYLSLHPQNEYLKGLDVTIATQARGVMCGSDGMGIGGSYGIGLALLGSMVTWRGDGRSDGMVSTASCIGAIPLSYFTNDSSSPYYLQKLNHADTTCRNGDSKFYEPFPVYRSPCDWFGAMAALPPRNRI